MIVMVMVLGIIVTACGGGGDAGTTATTGFGGDAVRGLERYRGTCMACHGEGGIGIEGLGKPWVGSDFINSRTDQEMYDFLLVGRPADHPDNTTGVAMLPKGGNPSLTDQDLYDLIAYMRTLNLGS